MDDGGPAFPMPHMIRPDGYVEWGPYGMSLRDWFAGQALAGLLSHPQAICQLDCEPKLAYKFADVMLAEREKQNEPHD